MDATTAHEALAAALLDARNAIVLTGLHLGVPESEDPTHARGEWAERANLEAFLTDPARFWEYFHPTALEIGARTPGPGHRALARMEAAGAVAAVITQAVDRLHARAGTRNLTEVYGTLLVYRCQGCGERYGLPELAGLIAASDDGIPRCDGQNCAHPLRPEGCLWGEPLPEAAVERAWALAAEADLLVIIDSDLRTAPISLLPSVPLTRGADLFVIGQVPTQYDRYARHVVREPSEQVLAAAADLIDRP